MRIALVSAGAAVVFALVAAAAGETLWRLLPALAALMAAGVSLSMSVRTVNWFMLAGITGGLGTAWGLFAKGLMAL